MACSARLHAIALLTALWACVPPYVPPPDEPIDDPPAPTGPPGVRFEDATPKELQDLVVHACLLVRDFDDDGAPDVVTITLDAALNGTPVFLHGLGNGSFAAPATLPIVPWAYDVCTLGDLDRDGHDEVIFAGTQGTREAPTGIAAAVSWVGGKPRDASNLLPPVGPLLRTLTVSNLDGDPQNELVATERHFFLVSNCERTPNDYQCQLDGPSNATAPLMIDGDAGGAAPVWRPLALPPGIDVMQHLLDWDDDGDLDLYRAIDFGESQLLLNDGRGHFTDALPALGGAVYSHNMGEAFADFDGDGALDFITSDVGPVQLWRQQPDGTLRDEAPARGVFDATTLDVSWTPIAADFDLDGDVDVYITNSAVAKDDEELNLIATYLNPAPGATKGRQGDRVLQNDGTGHFTASFVPDLRRIGTIGNGLASAADFDGDGRVDVMTNQVDYGGGTLTLMRNVSNYPGRHWIGLRGPRSVPPGTKLRITAPSGRVSEHRFVAQGHGASDTTVTFGLPPSDTTAQVEWIVPGKAPVNLGSFAAGKVHVLKP